MSAHHKPNRLLGPESRNAGIGKLAAQRLYAVTRRGNPGQRLPVVRDREAICSLLPAFIGQVQMARQIHAVMKEAQDLDHVVVRPMPEAEHLNMTPLAGDVQREKPLQDERFAECFSAIAFGNSWPFPR